MRYIYTTRSQLADLTEKVTEIVRLSPLDAPAAREFVALHAGYESWGHVLACLEVAPPIPTQLPDCIEHKLAQALLRAQNESASRETALTIWADLASSTLVSYRPARRPKSWPHTILEATPVAHPWPFLAEPIVRQWLLLCCHEDPLRTASWSEDDLLDSGFDLANDVEWYRLQSPKNPQDAKELLMAFKQAAVPEPEAILLRGQYMETCSLPDLIEGSEIIHGYDPRRDWRHVRYGDPSADSASR